MAPIAMLNVGDLSLLNPFGVWGGTTSTVAPSGAGRSNFLRQVTWVVDTRAAAPAPEPATLQIAGIGFLLSFLVRKMR
ncbi:MAG: hypothetical protein LAO79_17955 [Acidobacteriia bacterium]|nr:hypothetical protein [Terriglobia bacterium]